MSAIISPIQGGGGVADGSNIIDTLQDTLNAGLNTGSASGIQIDNGDVIAFASGSIMQWSSNSNAGGLPDVLLVRSGVANLAIYNPITKGPVRLNIGSVSTNLLKVAGTTDNIELVQSSASLTPANTQALHVTTQGLPVRFYGISSTAANAGGITASRFRGTISSPLATQAGDVALYIEGRAASANNLTQDLEAGKITFEVDSGTITAGNSMPSRIALWTTPNGSNVSVKRLQIGQNGSTDIGPNQLRMGSAIGTSDAAIVRSGVASIALTNPSTSGPASLTVNNLTILGTQVGGGGGLGSISTATGLNLDVNGTTSINSGIQLRSNEQNVLRITNRGGGAANAAVRDMWFFQGHLNPNIVAADIGDSSTDHVTFSATGGSSVIRFRVRGTAGGPPLSFGEEHGFFWTSEPDTIGLGIGGQEVWIASRSGISMGPKNITWGPTHSHFDAGLFRSGPNVVGVSGNISRTIEASGSISGALSIDFNGPGVRKFGISTTGNFTAVNMQANYSSEITVFVTGMSTVGLGFDSSWKWLGSKPLSLASGQVGMLTIMNRGGNAGDVLASYEVLGNG